MPAPWYAKSLAKKKLFQQHACLSRFRFSKLLDYIERMCENFRMEFYSKMTGANLTVGSFFKYDDKLFRIKQRSFKIVFSKNSS